MQVANRAWDGVPLGAQGREALTFSCVSQERCLKEGLESEIRKGGQHKSMLRDEVKLGVQ